MENENMFFKTFAEKQIEAKGRDYDRAVRKARLRKSPLEERQAQEIARLRTLLRAAKVSVGISLREAIERELNDPDQGVHSAEHPVPKSEQTKVL